MFMHPIVVSTLLNLGFVLGCQQSFGFSCKDQNNKDVDWFIVYKMPSMNPQSINGESTGTGYYYMDSNTLQLNPSSVPINFTNQAVAYTLNQLYSSRFNDSVFHVMYNDQQPDQETLPEWENIRAKRQSTIYAHAKGVSFFDRGSGVWLVHSVPMFPPRYAFSYPESGNIYGQSMLCRTFNYTQLPKIANQLYYIRPYIYSSGLPISMAAEISTLAKLISGEYKKGAPYSNVEEMITKGGTKFISIAKNAEFNADIYDGIVAPTLKTNLLTETWIKGYDITVNCSSIYPVVDVEYIKVGVSGQFRYTKDHSKLAISGDPTQPYICIGDINRMTSQYTRGGGTNCINNPEIWNTYFNMIQGTDPSDVCPVNN